MEKILITSWVSNERESWDPYQAARLFIYILFTWIFQVWGFFHILSSGPTTQVPGIWMSFIRSPVQSALCICGYWGQLHYTILYKGLKHHQVLIPQGLLEPIPCGYQVKTIIAWNWLIILPISLILGGSCPYSSFDWLWIKVLVCVSSSEVAQSCPTLCYGL